MSYWLRMGFREVTPENLIDELARYQQQLLPHYEEIIDDNKYYIPSIKGCMHKSEDNMKAAYADEAWLRSLFQIKCFYWKKYNLLGIISPMDFEDLSYFEFQNSTDQDYDYSAYPDLTFFKKECAKFESASIEWLTEKFHKIMSMNDEDIEEVIQDEETLIYYRKACLYKKIWKKLGLEHFLYPKDEETPKYVNVNVSCPLSIVEISKMLKFIKTYA